MRALSYFIAIFVFSVLGLALVFVLMYDGARDAPESSHETLSLATLYVRDIPFKVGIVDSPTLRARGLGGRPALSDREGLFFVFESPDYYGIWMKDMHFAIDILWIDERYRIVDIAHAVQPESYPEVFHPSEPARYVLEINAHTAEFLGIQPGDRVSFSPLFGR